MSDFNTMDPETDAALQRATGMAPGQSKAGAQTLDNLYGPGGSSNFGNPSPTDRYGNPILPGMNGQHDAASQYGTGSNIAGGFTQSGIRAGSSEDDPWLQFWAGQATPDFMKTQLGAAAQASGPAGNVMGAQNGLLAQLVAQAQGQGPSLATQQMQAGMQQNLRGMAALAASGRNPATASYGAVQGAGLANQATAQQAAMARTQEQMNAQAQLAALANAMAGQQIGNNQFNAGAQNQFGLAQGQLDQNAIQFWNNMMQQQLMQANGFLENKDVSRMNNNAQTTNGVIGGLAGAGGAGLQGLAMGK